MLFNLLYVPVHICGGSGTLYMYMCSLYVPDLCVLPHVIHTLVVLAHMCNIQMCAYGHVHCSNHFNDVSYYMYMYMYMYMYTFVQVHVVTCTVRMCICMYVHM